MSSYTFRWPHAANEVFVTGTFDDWGKTVQLERQDDIFQKTVSLPATDEKLQYKFVVDGLWTTDSSAPEENDGSNNINNVLYPDQIQKEQHSDSAAPSEPTSNTAVMAGVTPDSTTAAMAASVPKKGDQVAGAVPGTFPETPGHEPEAFSVNPIPASSGAGNPISLAPGEKVPDSSTFNSNTVGSTARTDPAGYEQDASHSLSGGSFGGGSSIAGLSDASNPAASASRRLSKMEPGSGLPVEGESVGVTDTGVTVESAAPNSTTAGLASQVPLKSQEQKSVNGGGVGAVTDVPSVVKNSLSEAHRDPEAAASEAAVKEKKEIEDELRQKVGLDESPGTPAPTSTAATTGAATSGTTSGAAATSGATRDAATSGVAPGTATTSGVAPGTATSDATSGAATSGAATSGATRDATTSGVAPGTATTSGATSGAATSGAPTSGATRDAATSGVAPGTATSDATPGTATSGAPTSGATSGGAASGAAPVASGNGTKSAPLSPRSSSPSQAAAGTGVGGAGATGPKGETAEGLTSQGGTGGAAGQTESSAANTAKQANGEQTARKDYADKARQEASDLAKDQKKKNRASGLFQKLKEKLK